MTDNTTMPDAKAQAAADKAYRKATRPWFKKKRFILPLILVLLMIITSVSNGGKSETVEKAATVATSTPTAKATPTVDPAVKAKADADAAAKKAADAEAKAKAEAEAAAKRGTPSQANALRSAEQYLSFTAFSHKGLVKQLVFEKYSTEDATWAADRVKVDWNAQAAKSAKQYLDMTAFSHAGLVKQLMFEGYTAEQAEFGVTAAGL